MKINFSKIKDEYFFAGKYYFENCISHNCSLKILGCNFHLPVVLFKYQGWKGTSRTKLCEELGWRWLSQCHWHKRMSKFHNIIYQTSHRYLTDLLHFRTLGCGNIESYFGVHWKSLNVFFPACAFSWSKFIKHKLRSIDNVTEFKES